MKIQGLDVLDQNSNVPRITHSELRTLLQSNSGNVVIIDLRDKALPGEPRIPGSQVVPGKIRFRKRNSHHSISRSYY